MPDDTYERLARAAGYSHVCGVDEAGRGPLAGPVCAAAVILPDHCHVEGLNDSKKLSAKKREALYEQIVREAVAYAVAYGTLEEIETVNILQATFLAMNRAIEALPVKADYAIIDGNRAPNGCPIPCETLVKGDARCNSVAAASILAKVTRDRLLDEYDRTYPLYGFSVHKGYGTKAHLAAIQTYGPCPVHRRSFLKKWL